MDSRKREKEKTTTTIDINSTSLILYTKLFCLADILKIDLGILFFQKKKIKTKKRDK